VIVVMKQRLRMSQVHSKEGNNQLYSTGRQNSWRRKRYQFHKEIGEGKH